MLFFALRGAEWVVRSSQSEAFFAVQTDFLGTRRFIKQPINHGVLRDLLPVSLRSPKRLCLIITKRSVTLRLKARIAESIPLFSRKYLS